jgi:hypothetical protein
MVGDSAVTSGDDTSKTAVIDGRGRYQTHYSYSNSGYKSVINSIVCSRDHAVLTVSTRTAASENDDGSYSLLYPKVGHYDKGRVSHISASSDLNGICTYHGLGNAVRGSLISVGDDSNRTVILGDNGNLVGFKEYSNRGYNKVVKAIVCEPGDGGVGTDRGDIDETVEISLRELRRMENEIKKLKQLVHQQRSEIGTLRTEKDTVKRQLELKIAELEQETKLNGKARKKLKDLKEQLRNLGNETL